VLSLRPTRERVGFRSLRVKVEFTTHDAVVIIWGNGRVSIEVHDFEDDPHHD